MSRNDDRTVGHPEEPAPANRGRSAESERLQRPGAGARVTGVHGVGAPDVTDHDIPAVEPGAARRPGKGTEQEEEEDGSGI